jgi:DNA end-binding protein Ku
LVPDGPAAEPGFMVLHAALVQRQRWALGRMVLSGHRQIVLVRPSGAALALQVLHYPEQVRSCPLPAPRVPDRAGEEMRLAGLLIDAAAGTIDWSAYRDQAAQELKALIEAKLAGQPVATLEPERAILPLLEALQQSVAAQNGIGAVPP